MNPDQRPQGWYLDPDGTDRLRYWTGNEWTPETRPLERPKSDYLAAETAPAPDDLSEGWKPDPLKNDPKEVRWWDGTRWTGRVGRRRTPEPARKLADRWGTWWVAGCVALGAFALYSAEACHNAIIDMRECSGTEQFAYDAGSGSLILIFAIVGIVGGVLLGKIQDTVDPR